MPTTLYKLRDPFSNIISAPGETTTQLHFEIDGMAVGTLHVPNAVADDICNRFAESTACGVLLEDNSVDWFSVDMKFYFKPIVLDDNGRIIDLSTLE